MQNSAMKPWLDSSWLAGANQSYIEQLYEDFLTDPDSVDTAWRDLFQQLPGAGAKPEQFHSTTREYFRRLAKDATRYTASVSDPETNSKQVKVLQLINAFRFRGHQNANLDPLALWKRDTVPDLNPSYHDLTDADFQESFNVGSFAIGKDTMKLGDLYAALKQTYCGSIGAEYMHLTNTDEKRWLQQRIESVVGQPSFSAEEKKGLLKELTAAVRRAVSPSRWVIPMMITGNGICMTRSKAPITSVTRTRSNTCVIPDLKPFWNWNTWDCLSHV